MDWLKNIIFNTPQPEDLDIIPESGYLRLLEKISARLFGVEESCVFYPFFTIRVHVLFGILLFCVGILGTYGMREVFKWYRDYNEKLTKSFKERRHEAGLVVERKLKVGNYSGIERRRLENGINMALAKVSFSRRDVENKFKLSALYNHYDVEIDELSVDMLKERLNNVRHDRHILKNRYTGHLYELSISKKRINESRKKLSNSKAVVSLLEDSDIDDGAYLSDFSSKYD